MNWKSALIIFVRKPVLGKVKTRLAANIGDENVLLVYKHLLAHTKSITQELAMNKFVFYADEIDNNDLWNGYEKNLQSGNDLGERMKNAFKLLLKEGFKKIIIIGSDCLEIESNLLNNAFKELEKTDVVIGPAKDGSYYLLGMKNDHSFLFDISNWSTASVYADSINLVNVNKLSFTALAKLNDVDTAADLPVGIFPTGNSK
ncbi:TIGR04282 family arsenosugar biosynthesis glycosyltransferase [soil metagenome]